MSFEKEIKLVEELCMTPGISGHEEKIAEIIKRELKDVADDIETLHKILNHWWNK